MDEENLIPIKNKLVRNLVIIILLLQIIFFICFVCAGIIVIKYVGTVSHTVETVMSLIDRIKYDMGGEYQIDVLVSKILFLINKACDYVDCKV